MLKNQKSKNEYSISETKRYACLHKMDSSSNLKATMIWSQTRVTWKPQIGASASKQNRIHTVNFLSRIWWRKEIEVEVEE
ncbi:hypothetical protein P8452_38779 [Trifolium repens]|nr:hypothetical protein P8452_38779 [Trifolium repens]